MLILNSFYILIAYKYGCTLVPYSEEDKNNMNYEPGEKGIKILGFTKSDNVSVDLLIDAVVLTYSRSVGKSFIVHAWRMIFHSCFSTTQNCLPFYEDTKLYVENKSLCQNLIFSVSF